MKLHLNLFKIQYIMRPILHLYLSTLLTCVPTDAAENNPPQGFVALFNGKNLDGWFGRGTEDPRLLWKMSDDELEAHKKKTRVNIKQHWSVKDGELINDGNGLYLTTNKDYADFELMVEYKTVAKADSGIYLRGVPQVQIWDTTKEGGKWNLGADKGSGGLWNNSPGAPGKNPSKRMDKPFGEWNKLRILMMGSKVTVCLNGVKVVDNAVMENFFDRKIPIFEKGPIQLQTHGGEIRWRNIFIREIPKKQSTGVNDLEIHVSRDGNDENPGTLARPLASLHRARDLVRNLRKRGAGALTVTVHEGHYYHDQPVVFTPEDSGTADAPIHYRSAPGEEVSLSGGVRFEPTWELYKDGIYKCDISSLPDFDQLFVNGHRQVRARYPNGDSTFPSESSYLKPAAIVSQAPHVKIAYDPKLFTQKRWSKPEEAIVHIFHMQNWGNMQWKVASVDYEKHQMSFGKGGQQLGATWYDKNLKRSLGMSAASRYFIDNVFEELDAEGEWYLDKVGSVLYYKPSKGVEIDKAVIEVPRLKHLLEFKGSKAAPVKHITFSGFRFCHTASTFMDTYEITSLGDWGIYRGGTVLFDGAENCGIKDSFFDAVGGNAIFVSNHARRIIVTGNLIRESGDSAICLVGKSHLNLDKSYRCKHCNFEHWWGWDKPTGEYPEACVVSNNHIHDIGVYGKQVAGVFMSLAQKNIISHNHIHDVPRAAICLHDGFWGGHVIEFNDIHDTVTETSDHGPFNSWGRERFWCVNQSHGTADHPAGTKKEIFADAKYTTVIRHNRFKDHEGWGIDLDDGSSNYHVYGNLCLGISIKLREGVYRTIENNIIIEPIVSLQTQVAYTETHDRIVSNIIVMNSKVDAPGVDVTYNHFRHNGAGIGGPFMPEDATKWADEIDYNTYFSDIGHFAAKFSTRADKRKIYSMKEWRAIGYGKHSIFADPMFVDPSKGDYRVKPGSPALKRGFKNFPMDQFGLSSDSTSRWSEYPMKKSR